MLFYDKMKCSIGEMLSCERYSVTYIICYFTFFFSVNYKYTPNV